MLPLAEQIRQLNIGIGELLAFHSSVYEKGDMERIPPVTAAYKVVEEIRDYSQLGGLKKEQDRLQQQIYMFNMFIASKQQPIMSLIPLQSMGSPTGSNKEAAIRTRNELLGSQQGWLY